MAELANALFLSELNALSHFKVGGSNPGGSILFRVEKFKKNGKFGLECACAVVGNALLRMHETSIFGVI